MTIIFMTELVNNQWKIDCNYFAASYIKNHCLRQPFVSGPLFGRPMLLRFSSFDDQISKVGVFQDKCLSSMNGK